MPPTPQAPPLPLSVQGYLQDMSALPTSQAYRLAKTLMKTYFNLSGTLPSKRVTRFLKEAITPFPLGREPSKRHMKRIDFAASLKSFKTNLKDKDLSMTEDEKIDFYVLTALHKIVAYYHDIDFSGMHRNLKKALILQGIEEEKIEQGFKNALTPLFKKFYAELLKKEAKAAQIKADTLAVKAQQAAR